MEPDKDTPQESTPPTVTSDQSASLVTPEPEIPADALNRTPEDLAEDVAVKEIEKREAASHPAEKKPSRIKKFFRKVNVYFLLFLLVLLIAGIIAAVTYINAQKDPVEPTIATQELTDEALQDLANTDSSIGSSNQTLTIQGSAIIDGQTLTRGNLNVAGNFQSGGSIRGTSLTISGSANLGQTQANALQVAQNFAVQGSTTLRDLSVSGTATFSGAVTVPQLTVSRLVLSGNGALEVPNHVSFSGPSPSRSINRGPLGGGGSASVSGSDTAGTINVNTGNSPQAGCFTRITFNQQFSSLPHVIVSPVGAAAGRTQFYTERDQSGFSLCVSTAAPANSSFAFDYFVSN